MFSTNPFSILSETVPLIGIQSFVVIMVALVILGTVMDMIHKKNVKYFFNNAKKAKKNAKRELGSGERIAVIAKTIVHDIGTTSELGLGKRRIAHVLGMYGTILFWIGSGAMIFFYTTSDTPAIWPILWHVGAIMTCLGGYWFWLFLRVDVAAEANSVFRIITADLFVLALLASSTFGLIWSYLQFNNISGWDNLFLVLFAVSNIVLFGGVYWSKFAHMFYKPGAAIQKNLAEADGSRDNFCWECYSCVKACPNHAIDVRGYADFAPMGHSVRVRREEEKGTISWKIKFRNGTEKDFVSPITTKPWGKYIPKLAEGDKPNQGEINSQILYNEPHGLNTDKDLPTLDKSSFKKGVYY